jgi:hypothetical protein
MQSIKLRSQIQEDGKIKLQLPQELANQEVEIILVYQTVESDQENQENIQEQPKTPFEILEESGFIGCCSAETDLSSNYKSVLKNELETKYDHR